MFVNQRFSETLLSFSAISLSCALEERKQLNLMGPLFFHLHNINFVTFLCNPADGQTEKRTTAADNILLLSRCVNASDDTRP